MPSVLEQITAKQMKHQIVGVKDGMVTMLQNGILKALEGVTTLEEVYRVVG